MEQEEKNKLLFESLKHKIMKAYDRGKFNRGDTTSTVIEDKEEDNYTIYSGKK